MRIFTLLLLLAVPLFSLAPAASAAPRKPVFTPVITTATHPTIVRHIRLKIKASQY